MKQWWLSRSLRLRLALWFTLVGGGILLALTPAVFWLIEHRLHVEFDRQLHHAWDWTASRLESDGQLGVRWRSPGADVGGQPMLLPASPFEVWKEGRLILRHSESFGKNAPELPPPDAGGEIFRTFELPSGDVRAMEQTTLAGGNRVTLRTFRDESGIHRTLHEILIGFALAVPIAAILSALGGYFMAGRMLKPIALMTERARQITSESLNERLPVSNPNDEFGQMAAVFNETLLRLQQSFDALRRFTADASHELRTPLTALRSVGEVGLRAATGGAALRETIGSMLEEAQHLHDLIDSLLLLTRVESGRMPLQIENIQLADLVLEVNDRIGVLAAEKQQKIEIIAEPTLSVSADRNLTRQAVLNILDNAIRYSPPRSTIQMKTFRENSRIGIAITDEGPGIASEYAEKIFERFFRIDKARSRAEGGAGLGLAIAKFSVEQQGGRIELSSIVGQGSTFRILLPPGAEKSGP